jgi:protein TonB
MGEHFDAVVVDCDNEQNATLLFKSARSAPNNQSALAVAVVEGQAGVAKAFRIGANLVLTKPINVEQAKGTLRVARGLLRKNDGAKSANPAAAATPVKAAAPAPKPVPQAAIPSPARENPIKRVVTPAPMIPPVRPPQAPSVVASTPLEINEDSIEVLEEPAEEPVAIPTQFTTPKIPSPAPSPGIFERKSSPSFAASAPAPARESKPPAMPEGKAAVITEPATPVVKTDRNEKAASVAGTSIAETPATAPEFTFGGAVNSSNETTVGGNKKILLAVAALIVVAAGGYGAWTQWGHSSTTNVPAHIAAQPAQTPAPQSMPHTSPVTTAGSGGDTETTASAANVPAHASKAATAVSDTSKPSPSATVASKSVATVPEAQPMVIKNNHSKPAAKSSATVDAPALSVTAIAPAGGAAALPNLMGPSNAPTPVLQKLVVSQGVSRGLLVKEVQPIYPRAALQMHIEGAVQMMATVSKNGDIAEVKVLSGDRELARAAVDAVKKWKYKPYLLNGEPVDIQTQITVNFKLPR